MATIDELTDKIPAELLKQSGKVFYSGRLAFAGPAPLYLLGVNPGGDPVNYIAETVSNHTETVLHVHPGLVGVSRRILGRISTGHVWHGTACAAPIPQARSGTGHCPGQQSCLRQVAARGRHQEHFSAIAGSMLAVPCTRHPAIEAARDRLHGQDSGRLRSGPPWRDRQIGEFGRDEQSGLRSRLFAGASGPRVVVATHPSIADWTAPSTDPSSLISNALAVD